MQLGIYLCLIRNGITYSIENWKGTGQINKDSNSSKAEGLIFLYSHAAQSSSYLTFTKPKTFEGAIAPFTLSAFRLL